MNPFANITSWKRKDFTPPPSTKEDIAKRFEAETETTRDLQKDIQQLLSDAHEEAGDKIREGTSIQEATAHLLKNLVGVNKRMVALLTVTAYETRITNWWIKTLTIGIFIGTLALVVIELSRGDSNSTRPYHQNYRHDYQRHHHHGQYYQEDR